MLEPMQPRGDAGTTLPTGWRDSDAGSAKGGPADAKCQPALSDAETSVASSSPAPSDADTESEVESGHEEESLGLSPTLRLPNFSGRWLLRGYEGNFDAMLQEGGVSWATRKMAKAGNYGVGIMKQEIRHEGNHMFVEFQAGPSRGSQSFVIGGGEQKTVDEKGDPLCVTPSWDGQSLMLHGLRAKSKKRELPSNRYLRGNEMIFEVRLSNGSTVKRFFRRCN